MKDVIILDDCIPVEGQKLIENYIGSSSFPWHYTPGISAGPEGGDSNSGFSNLVFSDRKNFQVQDSTAYTMLLPVVHIAVKKAYDKRIARTHRIRLGMFIRNQNNGRSHLPHVDQDFFHYTMLYYVNDSDGPTLIFDDLEITHKIEPKRGRCVIFDGCTYHASSCPQNHDNRIVCNYNFLL